MCKRMFHFRQNCTECFYYCNCTVNMQRDTSHASLVGDKNGNFVPQSWNSLISTHHKGDKKVQFLVLKYFSTKNVPKKYGGFHTEFTILRSKIFQHIGKYNSSFKNISYKNVEKNRGYVVQKALISYRKVQFLVQKYFLHQMLQKKMGEFVQKILQKNWGDFVQNSPFLVPKYFPNRKV